MVDEYMKHYNGESGTYFSFLPVHHKQSAGYECLLGAIEMGYIGKTFLKITLFYRFLHPNYLLQMPILDPTTNWNLLQLDEKYSVLTFHCLTLKFSCSLEHFLFLHYIKIM